MSEMRMKKPDSLGESLINYGFPYIFFAACVILAGFPAFASDAENPDSFSYRGIEIFQETLLLGNSDKDSAPSPFMGALGTSLRFDLAGRWSTSPELALTIMDYLYRDGKAHPALFEETNAVKALKIFFAIPVLYSFRPADDLSVFLRTGAVFSFNIPIKASGDASSGDVAEYFMEKGRFFHWEACVGFEWDTKESLAFTSRARLIVPVYRLWDGDKMPLYDGMMAGVSFGLRFRP